MKSILTILISIILVVSGSAQTRNVVVDTNGLVVQPTNIWTANATNARSGLGLGSSATNPSSAFQSSSSVLSNLASSNGVNITNISSSNIVGIISISSGGTGATNAAGARTAFGLDSASTNPASAFQSSSLALSNLASSNGGLLTNITAANIVGLIPSSNIPSVSFTNISGTLSLLQGGTSATNAADARQNLGSTTIGDALFISTNAAAARTTIGATTVGSSLFTLINPSAITFLRINSDNTVSALSASDFRTALSLGSAATNLSSAFQPASTVLSNLASSNASDLNIQASNIVGSISISNGGTEATNAGGARTNLGLGATWLTNTNVTNFRTAIGLGWSALTNTSATGFYTSTLTAYSLISSAIAEDPPTAREDIGLGWPALTNSNAGTGLVSVNTNGEVVSPTNFWQVAPIQTVVQNLTPITNSTNAATNARNLYVYSLATNITGVTNTVTLPTNTSTFAGDSATIIHQGTTSSVTAVRQAGAGSNLITINRFDESIKFIYENNSWTTYHNISFQEPIYFSGTNAAANAALSRTNLGLGATWLTNTNVTNFRTAIGLGETNSVKFLDVTAEELKAGTNTVISLVNQELTDVGIAVVGWNTNYIEFGAPLQFGNTANAATTRTNLGLGLPALTNTNVAGFQRAIFTTNAAPTNSANVNTVNFNTAVAWIEISVVTNSVTNSYRIPVFQ